MTNNLKVGDVVVLNSGGPNMTVTTVGFEAAPDTVFCVWFDNKNERQGSKFKALTLKKVDADGHVSREYDPYSQR